MICRFGEKCLSLKNEKTMQKMNLILIVFTFAILMIALNPQMIFGAYAPDEVEIQVTTDKASYKHGDFVTIKGSGVHSYTVFIMIISPQGEEIAELKFIAGRNGDFSTVWIIPNGIEQGIYTIQVEDIIKKAQTTFQLGWENKEITPIKNQFSMTSLKTQIKDGISNNFLICHDGFKLIFKLGDNSPACVKPQTAEKLIKRGWTTSEESGGVILLKQNIQNQTIQTIPASSRTVVNFYVNDNDLNTSPNGIDIVSTSGLIEITINGVMIDPPKQMIETSPNSGKFFLKIDLPNTINGKTLSQNDVFLIKYIDESDASGEKRIIVESFSLTKTFAKLQTYDGGNRIGHKFTLRIYEPDSNRDSRDEDKISLSALEFRSEGGIRTTLSNPVFDANSPFLTETGPNTSTFEVKIKIPRSIDGKTIHIGDWYEIRYIDRSTPSETNEKIILKGNIGLQ